MINLLCNTYTDFIIYTQPKVWHTLTYNDIVKFCINHIQNYKFRINNKHNISFFLDTNYQPIKISGIIPTAFIGAYYIDGHDSLAGALTSMCDDIYRFNVTDLIIQIYSINQVILNNVIDIRIYFKVYRKV
jgi:hypothetical protein